MFGMMVWRAASSQSGLAKIAEKQIRKITKRTRTERDLDLAIRSLQYRVPRPAAGGMGTAMYYAHAENLAWSGHAGKFRNHIARFHKKSQ